MVDEGLKELNKDFSCTACAKDLKDNEIATGRPSKGVAIFFRNTLINYIKVIEIDDCMVGITIETNIGKILALNVYLPYDNNDNDSLDRYRTSIATITSIIDEQGIVNVLVAGDLNADPGRGRFWRELDCLFDDYNLRKESEIMPSDTFTYLSAAHSSTSWLDHILVSDSLFEIIRNLNVDYNLALFDHFPLCCHFNLNLENLSYIDDSISTSRFVKWHKMSEQDFRKYDSNVSNALRNLDNLSLSCNESNCSNIRHLRAIDVLYEDIVNILEISSNEFTFDQKSFPKCVPGWNDRLKNLYIDARNKFKTWKNNGKALDCIEHYNMKESRSLFKNAFNKCKKDETKIRDEKLLNSLNFKDNAAFW